jgi:predicted CopG family antitoxin
MKIRKTIVVDKELWKKIKIQAAKEEKTISELFEEMIKKKLGEK